MSRGIGTSAPRAARAVAPPSAEARALLYPATARAARSIGVLQPDGSDP
jgi:hypothetical protein